MLVSAMVVVKIVMLVMMTEMVTVMIMLVVVLVVVVVMVMMTGYAHNVHRMTSTCHKGRLHHFLVAFRHIP